MKRHLLLLFITSPLYCVQEPSLKNDLTAKGQICIFNDTTELIVVYKNPGASDASSVILKRNEAALFQTDTEHQKIQLEIMKHGVKKTITLEGQSRAKDCTLTLSAFILYAKT
jgi:hypothetical protein